MAAGERTTLKSKQHQLNRRIILEDLKVWELTEGNSAQAPFHSLEYHEAGFDAEAASRDRQVKRGETLSPGATAMLARFSTQPVKVVKVKP
jgi:hypothetical protein